MAELNVENLGPFWSIRVIVDNPVDVYEALNRAIKKLQQQLIKEELKGAKWNR